MQCVIALLYCLDAFLALKIMQHLYCRNNAKMIFYIQIKDGAIPKLCVFSALYTRSGCLEHFLRMIA